MAQQAVLALADGKATPVTHNFTPNGSFAVGAESVNSAWVDTAGHALEIGRSTLREQHKAPNASGLTKVRHVLEVPTVELINGVNTRTRLGTIVIETWIDSRATQAERDDLAAYAKNFASSAYFAAKVKTGERTW